MIREEESGNVHWIRPKRVGMRGIWASLCEWSCHSQNQWSAKPIMVLNRNFFIFAILLYEDISWKRWGQLGWPSGKRETEKSIKWWLQECLCMHYVFNKYRIEAVYFSTSVICWASIKDMNPVWFIVSVNWAISCGLKNYCYSFWW